MCLAILSLCDLTELLKCSRCDHRFQGLVRKVFQQRIRSLLVLFVPEHSLLHFWSLLQASKSCIMGGVVTCAMMAPPYSDFHIDVAPAQLDLIVPFDHGHPSTISCWRRFLCSMGYRLSKPRPNPGSYAVCIESIAIYTHLVRVHEICYSSTSDFAVRSRIKRFACYKASRHRC